ncbi:MAG TPA: hypothetical protein VGC13_17560 [Longimicrobium sp.]
MEIERRLPTRLLQMPSARFGALEAIANSTSSSRDGGAGPRHNVALAATPRGPAARLGTPLFALLAASSVYAWTCRRAIAANGAPTFSETQSPTSAAPWRALPGVRFRNGC